MAFARQKLDTDGEGVIRQRYAELSDSIRARNKREDRLLNVRLKFYEREKNLHLNIIRREQKKLERVRTSLLEEAKQIQIKKQNMTKPLWMLPKSKIQEQLTVPDFIIDDWELNSGSIQSEREPSNSVDPTIDILRRHSAR